MVRRERETRCPFETLKTETLCLWGKDYRRPLNTEEKVRSDWALEPQEEGGYWAA